MSDIVECFLDEVLLALSESLSGLNYDQLWSHPIPERHSIGTIAKHVLLALDCYCGELQIGKMACEYEPAFQVYGMTVHEVEEQIRNRPGTQELLDQIETVSEHVRSGIHDVADTELRGVRAAEEICREWNKNSLELYLRGIFHAHGHIRQIWLLRGALGLTSSVELQWPTWQYA